MACDVLLASESWLADASSASDSMYAAEARREGGVRLILASDSESESDAASESVRTTRRRLPAALRGGAGAGTSVAVRGSVVLGCVEVPANGVGGAVAAAAAGVLGRVGGAAAARVLRALERRVCGGRHEQVTMAG